MKGSNNYIATQSGGSGGWRSNTTTGSATITYPPVPSDNIDLIKEDFIVINDVKCYRIKANIDFNNVKAGDLGGYISLCSSIKNNSWVEKNSKLVSSEITDNTIIKDSSLVVLSTINDSILKNVLCNEVSILKSVILSDTHISIIKAKDASAPVTRRIAVGHARPISSAASAPAASGTIRINPFDFDIENVLITDSENNTVEGILKYGQYDNNHQNVRTVLVKNNASLTFLDLEGNPILEGKKI